MNSLKCKRETVVLFLIGIGLVIVLAGCRSRQPSTPVSTSPVFPASPLETPSPEALVDLGGHVLFHRREQTGWMNIYVLDPETGDLTQLTKGQGNNYDPAWSPDGSRIAFISDRDRKPPYGTIWLMNADGSDPHPLLETGDYIELGPTWSPDGTRIAFQSNRGEGVNPDIFILDIASGALTNLTNHPNMDANPAWSPDGTKIAFVSDRSGNPEIWVVNTDGSELRQITKRPSLGDWRPDWSPDGRSLIFESYPTVAPRLLYIQDLDDAEAREVETFSVWNMWPAWVTDELILYAASEEYDEDTYKGSPANLYLQNLQTGEVHQLTSGPSDDGRPSWRP